MHSEVAISGAVKPFSEVESMAEHAFETDSWFGPKMVQTSVSQSTVDCHQRSEQQRTS